MQVESKRPLIAVTPDVSRKDDGRLSSYVHRDYTEAVIAAGGLPVVLPLTDDEPALDALLANVDGLLLTGGGDIDPSLYLTTRSSALKDAVKSVSPIRDAMELFLTRRLLSEGRRPILGICRGIQVLNVAAGGTLIVDLPSQVGLKVAHQNPKLFEPAHTVTVDSDSRLAGLMALTGLDVEVNSSHHQAVEKVASNFRAAAVSPADGVVEAIESSTGNFAVGVQWHPERLWKRHAHAAALFRALVDEAERVG